MPTPRLSFYNRFFDSLSLVAPDDRPAIFDALEGLRHGDAGIEVLPLGASGLRWFAVPATALQVVCHAEGAVLVLLYVGTAGGAAQWAQDNRVVRVGQTLRVVPRVQPVDPDAPLSNAPWGRASGRPRGPLARFRSRQLARFGIGASAAQVLRRLQSEDEVVELAELMLPAYADLMLGLATDEPLHELERRFVATQVPEPLPEAPLTQAATNAAQVYTPTTSEALEAALRGPPEAWAVFLHPQQQRAVNARTKGAVKVVGGPGTGKTVVAVHRARVLARDVFADAGRPVLLTVFTPFLTEPLQRMVDQLCEHEAEVRDRIEVLDFLGVAQRVLAHARRHHRVASPAVLDRCWEHAVAHAQPLGWSRAQLEAERTHVLGRNGAWTWEAYRDTSRQGRTVPLAASQREVAWRALHAFEEALADAGVGDELALVRAAEEVVRSGAAQSPFVSVVCDEVQDAGAAELRLLAALAQDPELRRTRPDGLFLVGDGYQRVYARPVPLTQCGIEVRGRSWTLRVNYRSTEQIRAAAMHEVESLEPDVLDAETEDSTEGYRSERIGPAVVRESFESEAEEATWIAARAAEGPLLVLVRHASYRDRLADVLRQHGLTVGVLDGVGELAERTTVSTVHRSKGLEAPRVVFAGAHQLPSPFRGQGEAERQWWERQEQCLSYVAMTRARDWLAVTRVG